MAVRCEMFIMFCGCKVAMLRGVPLTCHDWLMRTASIAEE